MTAAVLTTKEWISADGHPWRRFQRTVGFLVAATGAVTMLSDSAIALLRWVTGNPVIAAALIATAGTAGATALGALPVLSARRVSQKATDTMLGFGAGVMLAATAFSLIVPGIDAGADISGTRMWAAGMVAVALSAGGLLMLALDRALPHEHFVKRVPASRAKDLKRIWLFVAAIALHNLPEGLAVGVGFGGGDVAEGIPLAVGIGVQNIPEGLVVALALAAVGYSAGSSVTIAAATGLMEPIGGLLGAGMVATSTAMLPWGLGFAAGAMLFVVSHEIIPESHRKGHEQLATVGLIAGFVLMMVLDTALA